MILKMSVDLYWSEFLLIIEQSKGDFIPLI